MPAGKREGTLPPLFRREALEGLERGIDRLAPLLKRLDLDRKIEIEPAREIEERRERPREPGRDRHVRDGRGFPENHGDGLAGLVAQTLVGVAVLDFTGELDESSFSADDLRDGPRDLGRKGGAVHSRRHAGVGFVHGSPDPTTVHRRGGVVARDHAISKRNRRGHARGDAASPAEGGMDR